MPVAVAQEHPRHIGMGSIRGLPEFKTRMATAKERIRVGLAALMVETKNRWVYEAKKRAPIDTGDLVDSIEGAVEVMGDTFLAMIGTNTEYARFTEFGTRRMAGGRVLALGTDPNITDADAIFDWPAKRERPNNTDQMPWMRPSWWAIEPWFMEQLQLIVIGAFRA